MNRYFRRNASKDNTEKPLTELVDMSGDKDKQTETHVKTIEEPFIEYVRNLADSLYSNHKYILQNSGLLAVGIIFTIGSDFWDTDKILNGTQLIKSAGYGLILGGIPGYLLSLGGYIYKTNRFLEDIITLNKEIHQIKIKRRVR